ncbi:MAG: ABC transporter permease [Thermomicrobiales bacterium]
MHPRMIHTILRKDFFDAIRDARVLVALIVPLGIGIFYNLTFDDETPRPDADVVYAAAGETTLPQTIEEIVGEVVDVTFEQAADEADVQRLVDDDDADLGLVIPAGFDDAVAAGQQPALTVVTPPDPNLGADYVIAAIDPALRQMAGQAPPAQVQIAAQAEDEGDESVFDRLGLRTWSVMVSAVMMIAMISVLAIPVILAEEAEKKTLDALVLIASYADVVAAKALLGLIYVAIMVPLLLTITGLSPDDMPLFVAGVAVLAVTLLGFGLFLGGLFKSANQLNTWSGVLLAPLVAPAFMVGLPLPDLLATIVGLIPTGAATKLLINGMEGEAIFSGAAAAFLVVLAWGVVAYGLLLWNLQRRQA